ncbi:MAG: DUF2147 domain-containing protein [Hyphomicrobiales bacterium]|nr:DUF2147 domain-containing protein [Hyphomicrobiales bacterium]MDE2113990.1 DUF2147 domain-containing protein [Hyphomicrobiales bacterium]
MKNTQNKSALLGAAFAACMVVGAGAALAASPNGVWTTEDGKARVQISNCGPAICGRVIWLRQPNGKDGKPELDFRNANPALRKRPMLGVPVLESLKPSDGQWKGRIYNGEDGKTYAAYFKLMGDNKAQVQGCFAGFLCKSQIWTRH